MRLFKNKRGDTIVEVLLAITALSLVLSGAYVLANRSTLSFRQAQERGESQKIAQSQLELLKKYLTVPDPEHGVPNDGEVFCLVNVPSDDPDETRVDVVKFPIDKTPPVDAQAETFDAFASTPTNTCRIGTFYHNYIVREGDIFTVHTRWASARGAGIEEATMVHRIYPDLAAMLHEQSITNTGCPPNHFRKPLGGCGSCVDIFGPGYESPGDEATECIPIPPRITVVVQKVRPGAGSTTPSCTSNDLESRANATVTLTGNSNTFTGNTSGTPSSAVFGSGLSFGRSYTATFTAPGGTNPTGTDYNPSGGPSFTKCPTPASLSHSVPALPAGAANEATLQTFKFIPNCYAAAEYGWQDLGSNHVHAIYEPVLYHEHPADTAPFNPSVNTPPPADGRRAGWPLYTFDATEAHGGVSYVVRYVYRGDLGQNSNGWFYEQWVWRSTHVRNEDHWHPDVKWVRTGWRNVCPS